MRLSRQFLEDAGERAGKGGVYAFGAYAFEAWLNTLVALTMTERGLIWAAGNVVLSIVGSLISRRFGRRGTASLTRTVDYEPM